MSEGGTTEATSSPYLSLEDGHLSGVLIVAEEDDGQKSSTSASFEKVGAAQSNAHAMPIAEICPRAHYHTSGPAQGLHQVTRRAQSITQDA